MTSLPNLPTTLTILLNGNPLHPERKLNNAGTGFWFIGTNKVWTHIEGAEKGLPDSVREAAVSARFDKLVITGDDGVEFNRGEVHVTAPSVFRKGHAKEGQVISGSGGNVNLTFSRSLAVRDLSTGEALPYNCMAMFTYVADMTPTKAAIAAGVVTPDHVGGIRVKIQAMRQPAPRDTSNLDVSSITSLLSV